MGVASRAGAACSGVEGWSEETARGRLQSWAREPGQPSQAWLCIPGQLCDLRAASPLWASALQWTGSALGANS